MQVFFFGISLDCIRSGTVQQYRTGTLVHRVLHFTCTYRQYGTQTDGNDFTKCMTSFMTLHHKRFHGFNVHCLESGDKVKERLNHDGFLQLSMS